MISSTVMSLLTAGVLGFYMFNYKIGFINKERNQINADMRSLTASLIDDGRPASYFTLYDSIAAEDRDSPGDRRLDGRSGDLLVLAYTEKSSQGNQPNLITRIIAYFRGNPDADGLAPIFRIEQVIDPPSAGNVESLIPSESVLLAADEVVALSRGLPDSGFFYNFSGRSFMVSGQFVHGNAAKRVTETFNLTVSPRGKFRPN